MNGSEPVCHVRKSVSPGLLQILIYAMLGYARFFVGRKTIPPQSRGLSSFSSGRYDPYNALTARWDDVPGGEGKLGGWSVSVKENIAMEGIPTTCSSKMLEMVRRLRGHGARITSRNNCDEFAMGGLNKHSLFGPVANPAPYENVNEPDFAKYPPRAPGGSSGGAAAAVRANLCRVRWGVVSYADSLDTVGIIARVPEDLAVTFDALAAPDSHDATCIDMPMRAKLANDVGSILSRLQKPLQGLRVGIVAQMFPKELHPEIADITDDVLDALQHLGATLVDVSFSVLSKASSAYYIQALSEASSNLGRYDGIRYGSHHEEPRGTFFKTIAANRSANFGEEVKRRILLGTFALTSEAWKSHLQTSIQIRNAITHQMRSSFAAPDQRVSSHERSGDDVDLLVYPTAMRLAPRLNEETASEYAQDVLTVSANLTGMPVLSAPASRTVSVENVRLPTGISFQAQWGHDQLLLHVVETLARNSDVLAI
ncbi:unnamed protein product [Malassezia sympodialis ATCC 42132]|uniref:uncharacterized protein n=1 Tax=Malassezia sympodialis (strain ATCC 42132) TaxID=1230383 RepID=UPI0002C1A14A|nr:uncharacterized protein MSY001_1730 [Malassezia sympodialis ATCC 42132]CCU99024.1 unnamed protein product [Malassezia sympodialis ATCC 42132]|eukprot:XP_018740292.1 uncharacterized protein MSY001_1730 [Malassezia sympodialis ATCC 42132]